MSKRASLREAAIVAETVARGLELPAITAAMPALADAARIAFGAAACSVAVIDAATSELEYIAASGEGAAGIIGVRLPLTRGLASYSVIANETLAIDDVRADPRFASDIAERTGYVPRTMLVAPAAIGDRVLGVLSILDRTGPSGIAALELANRFATMLAGLIEVHGAAQTLATAIFEAAASAATATADRPDVAATLRALAREARADNDITQFAATLASLRNLGIAEQRLALRVLDEIIGYGTTRRTRR